jgi:3'(2'), 5'-bisphosphate nucleotidase
VTGPGYAREVEVARTLARAAGALALRLRGGDLGVELKGMDDPVTVADRQASELILAGLGTEFPADVLVSEEACTDDLRFDAERVWFIDPIDGTKDFIRGQDGFSVMIGLNVDGRPTVGVVYQPVGDRMFSAEPEAGTQFFAPDARPRRLACSTHADPAAIRLVASKSHREGVIDEVKSTLGIRDELNIGSVGLKLSLIALGERDLYVNPSPKCKAWDTCAPAAVLHHAGGRFTDLFGDPLRYDDAEAIHHRHGLVASNGPLHAAVLAKLAPLFPRPPR